MTTQFNRRQIISAAAVTAVALMAPSISPAQSSEMRFKIIAFSKPFQTLNPDQTAGLVAEAGWDGIECPVRAKGQVEPERVEEDLPKLAEAMKKRQREIVTITTDINEVNPLNEKVLRAASKLGIKKFRMAHWKYTKDKPISQQLAELAPRCRDLAAFAKDLDIQAGFQNHSGADYVGAPLWDIYSLIKDLDPRHIAAHFDIGHATLEGGLSWPIQARLLQPHYGAVYVKDFRWEPSGRTQWCPLGQGFVQKRFFEDLKKSSYTGPICQHHEYFLRDATIDQMKDHFKKDLQTLRSWL